MFSRNDANKQAKRLKEKNEALIKAMDDIDTGFDVSSDIDALNNLRSRLDSPMGVAELFEAMEEESPVLQNARQTVRDNHSILLQIQTDLLRRETEARIKRSELVKELQITSTAFDEVMKRLYEIGDRTLLNGTRYDNVVKERDALQLAGDKLSSQLTHMDAQLPEEQKILREAEQVAKNALKKSIRTFQNELNRNVYGEFDELDIESEESRAETIKPVVSEIEKLKNAVDLADRNLKGIQDELTQLNSTSDTYDKKASELSAKQDVALSEFNAAKTALKSAQEREERTKFQQSIDKLEQSIDDAQKALDMHAKKIIEQIEKDAKRGPELDDLIKLKENEIRGSFVKVFKNPELAKLIKEKDAILLNQQSLLEKKLELSGIVEDRKRLLEVAKKDQFDDEEDDEEDEDIDEQVKYSGTIKTVYEKELPGIKNEIASKRSALTRVETAIADWNSKNTSVIAQDKMIVHLNYQITHLNHEIKTLQNNLKQSIQERNALAPKGLLGNFFEAFKHLFFDSTAYDLAINKVGKGELWLNKGKLERASLKKELLKNEGKSTDLKQEKAKSKIILSTLLVSEGSLDELKRELVRHSINSGQ